MELVAFIGDDRESWGQVTGLINKEDWEKIILVKNKIGQEYISPKQTETVNIDSSRPLTEIKTQLLNELKQKISGFEANLSIASGNGKEHMALISALLTIPVGIRLVVFTKNGIEWVN